MAPTNDVTRRMRDEVSAFLTRNLTNPLIGWPRRVVTPLSRGLDQVRFSIRTRRK